MYDDVARCFETHRARVYRWAYAMCRRHDAAADVLQDVFVRILCHQPIFPSDAAAIAWLRKTTANVVIDHWRSTAGRGSAEPGPRALRSPVDALETSELAEQARAAMSRLSHQQCLILLARVYDQVSFREIAEELEITASSAKTHYLRALLHVRKYLGIDVPAGSKS